MQYYTSILFSKRIRPKMNLFFRICVIVIGLFVINFCRPLLNYFSHRDITIAKKRASSKRCPHITREQWRFLSLSHQLWCGTFVFKIISGNHAIHTCFRNFGSSITCPACEANAPTKCPIAKAQCEKCRMVQYST